MFLHHGKIGNPKEPGNPALDPRILVTNACVDSPDVCLVSCDGFLPSAVADRLQELAMIDRCRINISLKSFVSLIKQIHRAPEGQAVNRSDASAAAQ
jgi:hypothetical protein